MDHVFVVTVKNAPSEIPNKRQDGSSTPYIDSDEISEQIIEAIKRTIGDGDYQVEVEDKGSE